VIGIKNIEETKGKNHIEPIKVFIEFLIFSKEISKIFTEKKVKMKKKVKLIITNTFKIKAI